MLLGAGGAVESGGGVVMVGAELVEGAGDEAGETRGGLREGADDTMIAGTSVTEREQLINIWNTHTSIITHTHFAVCACPGSLET